MVKCIETITLADAYKQAIQYIVWNHRELTTEDKEVVWRSKDTLIIHATNPTRDIDRLADYYPMGIQGLNTYVDEVMGVDERDTKSTTDDFCYTYHERLCTYDVLMNLKQLSHDQITRNYTRLFTINQVDEMVKKLTGSPITRRACAITWRPYEDNYPNVRSPPCLQWIKCEIVDGRLNMYTLWRSRDILLGMGANIYALHHLHAAIAAQCECEVGFYEDINVDAHIYYKRDGNYLKRWMT